VKTSTPYDERGNVDIAIGSIRDVTESKEAKDDLKDRKVLLKNKIDRFAMLFS
jgi:hypothetical protein